MALYSAFRARALYLKTLCPVCLSALTPSSNTQPLCTPSLTTLQGGGTNGWTSNPFSNHQAVFFSALPERIEQGDQECDSDEDILPWELLPELNPSDFPPDPDQVALVKLLKSTSEESLGAIAKLSYNEIFEAVEDIAWRREIEEIVFDRLIHRARTVEDFDSCLRLLEFNVPWRLNDCKQIVKYSYDLSRAVFECTKKRIGLKHVLENLDRYSRSTLSLSRKRLKELYAYCSLHRPQDAPLIWDYTMKTRHARKIKKEAPSMFKCFLDNGMLKEARVFQEYLRIRQVKVTCNENMRRAIFRAISGEEDWHQSEYSFTREREGEQYVPVGPGPDFVTVLCQDMPKSDIEELKEIAKRFELRESGDDEGNASNEGVNEAKLKYDARTYVSDDESGDEHERYDDYKKKVKKPHTRRGRFKAIRAKRWAAEDQQKHEEFLEKYGEEVELEKSAPMQDINKSVGELTLPGAKGDAAGVERFKKDIGNAFKGLFED